MHGVGSQLDLSAFCGLEVIQVALGAHQIQLALHPSGNISIEGRLELFSPDGLLAESGTPEDIASSSTCLQSLVGASIDSASPEPPKSVVFGFSSGHRLRLIDDSDRYESFQLNPGGIVV